MPLVEVGQGIRGNFVSSYGGFRTKEGRIARTEPSKLRELFLPNLSDEGREILAENGPAYVRAQLLHYGIPPEDHRFSGNGAELMKQVIQEGLCDRVPDHLVALEEEMHNEWLHSLTPEQVGRSPNLTMQKYFLTAGRPDKTKTTALVTIFYKPSCSTRSKRMMEAAGKVEGLFCARGTAGRIAEPIVMGWDKDEVEQTAANHVEDEARRVQERKEERQWEHDELHANYLDFVNGTGGIEPSSPVGRYIVECAEIDNQWKDLSPPNMTLDIHETYEDGLFQVDFNFGVLKGVMLLCMDQRRLNDCIVGVENYGKSETELEDENENDKGWEVTGEETAERLGTSSNKRKYHPSPDDSGQKRARMSGPQPIKYFLKLRCRKAGEEGELSSLPEEGFIEFEDLKMVAFSGKLDLPYVGGQIPFSGRKVSDEPISGPTSWLEYSEKSHDYGTEHNEPDIPDGYVTERNESDIPDEYVTEQDELDVSDEYDTEQNESDIPDGYVTEQNEPNVSDEYGMEQNELDISDEYGAEQNAPFWGVTEQNESDISG
ncbi:unnamed protein product [Clonostachys rosea]|uniref:Uncharacterized protein n=1 Tax=Bionectria ochroleuca TaxID=29856 RepID=A0ABY6UC08_BIOOC|nr:unnamed protein product [Clonostachys rosea]